MDSELPNSESDLQPPRRLKRRRRSYTDNCVHPIVSEKHDQPKDLTFIADSVNGKGKKPPLSCCECRRLKLKCDRHFPCSSCKKRGCAEICPDGVLVSGKGTRFILANTERLHGKIQEMSERIRSLEEALKIYHAEHCGSSEDIHPLLQPDLLGIKSTVALYSSAQSLSVDTATHYISPDSSSPGTDHENEDLPKIINSPTEFKPRPSDINFASEISSLSRNFPLSESGTNPQLREYIRRNLPPRETADYLWQQVQLNALWQYNPHSNPSFYPELAYHCYSSPVHELSPRSLALLFMILAVGCMVDLKRIPNHPDSEKYHQLARASLCEIPIMEDTSTETITTLFYEIWYLLVFSDTKKAAGYAWGLMGLTAKLAQSIGLHRNSSGRSKITQEEVEKRQSLCWELLHLDARLSLSLGRPPSLSASHVDCPRPSYSDPSVNPLSYQEWKHACYLHCLAPVIDAISQPSLSYDTVLDLDRQIRDFSLPNNLKDKLGNSRYIVVQKASLSTALETVLLQLHRQFFIQAISTPEEAFDRRHKYAPSVVAVYLSASRIITSLQDLYSHEPNLATRFLGYWSNALSAVVALCLLVNRAPSSCLCPAALQDLERARALFHAARDTCPRAMEVIPIIETMVRRTNDIYSNWLKAPATLFRSRSVDVKVDSGSVKPGNFAESVLPTPPIRPQSLPHSQDSFSQAHPSLVQCINEVHQQTKALISHQNLCHCATVVDKREPHWHLQNPRPHLVPVRPFLSEIPTDFDFDKAYSVATAYANLPIIHNGMIASPHGYLPSPSPPQGEENFYGEIFHTSTLLPHGEVPLSSVSPSWMLSPSSKMVETLNFDLGALNAKSDQNWMAFF